MSGTFILGAAHVGALIDQGGKIIAVGCQSLLTVALLLDPAAVTLLLAAKGAVAAR